MWKNSTFICLRWFRWYGINCFLLSVDLVAEERKVEMLGECSLISGTYLSFGSSKRKKKKKRAMLLASLILLSWCPDLLRGRVVPMLSEISTSLSPGYMFFLAFCGAQTFFSSTHVSPPGISTSFILVVLLLFPLPASSRTLSRGLLPKSLLPGLGSSLFSPPRSPLPFICCHLICWPDVRAHPRPNPSAKAKYPQYGRFLNQAGHSDHNITWEDNRVYFFHSLGCSVSWVVFRMHTGRTGACTGERGKCP